MPTIKVSLKDNDYLVHASAELPMEQKENSILDLIQHLNEDFVPGEEAVLEVEGWKSKPQKYLISHIES